MIVTINIPIGVLTIFFFPAHSLEKKSEVGYFHCKLDNDFLIIPHFCCVLKFISTYSLTKRKISSNKTCQNAFEMDKGPLIEVRSTEVSCPIW